MSDTDNSGKNSKKGKRKPKDLESEHEQQEKSNKKVSPSHESNNPEGEFQETRLVPYKKNSDSNSSSDEEEKYAIVPFQTDISSNPLNNYNTFVCHLGNWKTPLTNYLKIPQFRSIFDFVRNEYDIGTCFPPKNLIFNAFHKTPFDKLKVVMLGDAPSTKFDESLGLAYSVARGAICPPALENVYKALVKDPKINFRTPQPLHGDLGNWADQGVLMLNNSLTTREGHSNSHTKAGWKLFTKAVLEAINKEKEGVVFLCWGGKSQRLMKNINRKKHHVLTYGNPSPLSQKFQKFED